MHINFFKADKSEYTLGTVSFNWLNEHDAFDAFSEDDEYTSDIILLVTGVDKCNQLADVVKTHAETMPREDLRAKILGLSDFLKGADKIVAVLDQGFPHSSFFPEDCEPEAPSISREDELEGRVIELESAIRWWYTEKMRNYNDQQYGKGELKRILNNNPIVKPLD